MYQRQNMQSALGLQSALGPGPVEKSKKVAGGPQQSREAPRSFDKEERARFDLRKIRSGPLAPENRLTFGASVFPQQAQQGNVAFNNAATTLLNLDPKTASTNYLKNNSGNVSGAHRYLLSTEKNPVQQLAAHEQSGSHNNAHYVEAMAGGVPRIDSRDDTGGSARLVAEAFQRTIKRVPDYRLRADPNNTQNIVTVTEEEFKDIITAQKSAQRQLLERVYYKGDLIKIVQQQQPEISSKEVNIKQDNCENKNNDSRICSRKATFLEEEVRGGRPSRMVDTKSKAGVWVPADNELVPTSRARKLRYINMQ